jgi:hypothetical protein
MPLYRANQQNLSLETLDNQNQFCLVRDFVFLRGFVRYGKSDQDLRSENVYDPSTSLRGNLITETVINLIQSRQIKIACMLFF